MADKAASVDAGSNYNRKMMNWRFTGQKSEKDVTGEDGNVTHVTEYDRGILAPGQGIVVELIVPVQKEASDLLSEDLLTTAGYGYKPGTFTGYTPATSDNDGSTRGLVSDTRDVNLDGKTSQSMVMMQLKALEFTGDQNLSNTKTVTTDLEALANYATNGAAGVPEGTTYEYYASAVNPEADESKARNFNNIALYDILPFESDYKIWSGDNGEPTERGSQWSGWLKDLDSIQVVRFSAADTTLGKDGQKLVDGTDMNLSLIHI